MNHTIYRYGSIAFMKQDIRIVRRRIIIHEGISYFECAIMILFGYIGIPYGSGFTSTNIVSNNTSLEG